MIDTVTPGQERLHRHAADCVLTPALSDKTRVETISQLTFATLWTLTLSPPLRQLGGAEQTVKLLSFFPLVRVLSLQSGGEAALVIRL